MWKLGAVIILAIGCKGTTSDETPSASGLTGSGADPEVVILTEPPPPPPNAVEIDAAPMTTGIAPAEDDPGLVLPPSATEVFSARATNSAVIAVVTCTAETPRLQGDEVMTDLVLRVDRVLKGDNGDQPAEYSLTIPGGTMPDGLTTVTSHYARYYAGAAYVVFADNPLGDPEPRRDDESNGLISDDGIHYAGAVLSLEEARAAVPAL